MLEHFCPHCGVQYDCRNAYHSTPVSAHLGSFHGLLGCFIRIKAHHSDRPMESNPPCANSSTWENLYQVNSSIFHIPFLNAQVASKVSSSDIPAPASFVWNQQVSRFLRTVKMTRSLMSLEPQCTGALVFLDEPDMTQVVDALNILVSNYFTFTAWRDSRWLAVRRYISRSDRTYTFSISR